MNGVIALWISVSGSCLLLRQEFFFDSHWYGGGDKTTAAAADHAHCPCGSHSGRGGGGLLP